MTSKWIDLALCAIGILVSLVGLMLGVIIGSVPITVISTCLMAVSTHWFHQLAKWAFKE